MRLIRRISLWVIGISLTVGALVLAVRTLTEGTPLMCRTCNVIIISIGSLSAGHTGVYAPSVSTTPFLKKLADERAVVFERAYAQAPWTIPSAASMLTGHYPWDLNIWNLIDPLPQTSDTVARVFKDAGYRTALFSNGIVQSEFNFNQGFDEVEGTFLKDGAGEMRQTLADSVRFAEASTTVPFFMFIRPGDLHDSYGPGAVAEIAALNMKTGGPTANDAEKYRTIYDAQVSKADAALENFFKALDDSGLSKNTIVILTSDQGEEFNEHGTVGHHAASLYDESIRVPLMIVIPKVGPKRVRESVETRSIKATVLELTGIFANSGQASDSLVPFIQKDGETDRVALSATAQARNTLFTFLDIQSATLEKIAGHTLIPSVKNAPFKGPYASAAIQGKWKVIKQPDGEVELYDTEKDPGENNNIFSEKDGLQYEDKVIITKLLRLVAVNGI